MATIQEASQAKSESKVVVTDYAGRRVTVNALSQGRDGWVMSWSHKDYPEAHVDQVDDSQEFVIRSKYARYV